MKHEKHNNENCLTEKEFVSTLRGVFNKITFKPQIAPEYDKLRSKSQLKPKKGEK
jgi:hypothetical protein